MVELFLECTHSRMESIKIFVKRQNIILNLPYFTSLEKNKKNKKLVKLEQAELLSIFFY